MNNGFGAIPLSPPDLHGGNGEGRAPRPSEPPEIVPDGHDVPEKREDVPGNGESADRFLLLAPFEPDARGPHGEVARHRIRRVDSQQLLQDQPPPAARSPAVMRKPPGPTAGGTLGDGRLSLAVVPVPVLLPQNESARNEAS